MDKRAEIDRIRQENQRLYGETAETRQILDTFLPRTFPTPWIFLFELTQNAIDVGARRIRLTTGPGRLLFEHDGGTQLQREHVRALSKLGMSTKRLSSVGFMGVGFKSVFQRFRRARVAGDGWKLRFQIGTIRGARNTEFPDWLGTVLPEWDDDAPLPEDPFTTVFELSDPDDPVRRIEDDLINLVSPKAPTTLAVLAVRGLRQITIDGKTWNLEHDAALHEARVTAGEHVFRWCAILHAYTPSDAAIRCLIQFRRTTFLNVEDEQALEHQRQVLGLIPLTAGGTPEPPERGHVFATLPTGETLPFGMHVQADWFVDITRRGLVAVDGNPWQQQIVEQLPVLVADYLRWLTGRARSRSEIREGLKLLGIPRDDLSSALDAALDTPLLRSKLHDALHALPFLPQHGGIETGFLAPDDAVFLPEPLATTFGERSEWMPDVLFGGATVDAYASGKEPRRFLSWLDLEVTLDHADLAEIWPSAIEKWWAQTGAAAGGGAAARRHALFALWSGIARLAASDSRWSKLPCVPTDAGPWISAGMIRYLDLELPSDAAPGGAHVREWITPFLPHPEVQIPIELLRALRQTSTGEREDDRQRRLQALRWFEGAATAVALKDIIQNACKELLRTVPLQWTTLIYLAEWARHQNQAHLVEHLVVDTPDGEQSVVPCGEALIAEPYIERGQARTALFPNHAISEYYLGSTSTNSADWRAFFEGRGAKGALRLVENRKWYARGEDARVAEALGIRGTEVGVANNNGYDILDYDFMPPWPPSAVTALAPWLEDEHTVLRGRGRVRARSFFAYERMTLGQRPCTWVQKLATLSWVPTDQGRHARPSECLETASDDYENAPVARLSPGLLKTLLDEGLSFGTAIPKSAAIRRLALRSVERSPAELAALLHEAITDVAGDQNGLRELREVLEGLSLPAKDGRVPLSRLVRRTGGGTDSRSGLGGYVVALGDLAAELSTALLACPIPSLPDTTTGAQALGYLEHVWFRARTDATLPAEPFRPYLRLAYSYVLDDIRADAELKERWRTSRNGAMVHGRGGWRATSTRPFVDDLSDPRVRSMSPRGTVTVTAGHFGESESQIRRVAKALELPLLSETLKPDWERGPEVRCDRWIRHFGALKGVLDQLTNRAGEGIVDLEVVEHLRLRVQGKSFEVNARIIEHKLVVTGTPEEFMDEATAELVEAYTLGQRGAAVAVLAGTLLALDDGVRFTEKLKRLAELLEVRFEPAMMQAAPTENVEPGVAPKGAGLSRSEGNEDRRSSDDAGARDPEAQGAAGETHQGTKSTPTVSPGGRSEREQVENDSPRPRKEHSPGAGPDMRRLVAAQPAGGQRAWPDDARARGAVMAYEEQHGRKPDAKPFNNEGYDIESHDPVTGRARRIEVKGTWGIWEGDASVILSARQFRDPQLAEARVEHWLYVVDSSSVIPIPWASRGIDGYVFYARDWVDLAVEPAPIAVAGAGVAREPEDTTPPRGTPPTEL